MGRCPDRRCSRRLLAPSLLRLLRGVLCAACLCGGAPAHADEAIRVVTEELPPFNMTQGGRVTGLATEIVEAVMRQAGVAAKIESMPWGRCYETALTGRNVLIYSILRTPERETLFKWIGNIGVTEESFLYARPDRHLPVHTLDEARRYRVATVNGDSSEQYLLAHGFDLETNLSRGATSRSGYDKLRTGRVDLWLADRTVAAHVARLAGDDPARAVVPLVGLPLFDARVTLMMAFGANTPDALVQRFRAALDAIHANGEFDAIQQRWH